MKVNMTPNPLDVVTIHASQGDTEARQWEFELHNNGELIDTSDVKEQLVFKAYKGGTEQILPENTSTPTTSPFLGDIRYPQGLLTDQEFTYRQSPTEEDGLAKITDIKGNTLVWNQLVQNGNFADTSGWTSNYQANTIVSNANELTVTVNTLAASVGIYTTRNLSNRLADHKYLFKVDVYVPHATTCRFGNEADYIQRNVSVGWNKLTSIVQNSLTSKSIVCYITAQTGQGFASGESFKIRNYQCFDLTQMGLDITDQSEFTSLFSLSYYSYNQGSLLSFNGNGIKTTGKNLFPYPYSETTKTQNGLTFTDNGDGTITVNGTATAQTYFNLFINTSEARPKMIGGTYVFSNANSLPMGTQVTLTARKSDGTAISSFSLTNNRKEHSLTIGENFEYNSNISISSGTTLNNYVFALMFELGSTATDYEPYTESTTDLPISTYFPSGMKSAGSVYDELTESKAITRIGAVDLGSLDWIYHSSGNFYAENAIRNRKVPLGLNAICPIYQQVNEDTIGGVSSLTLDKSFAFQTSVPSRIIIKNTSYNDATAFKTAMSGVYLYYELATETETSFTTASLVTENTEIPLSNEDGTLIGKCTEELSAEPGFHDAKIKLSDSDGECYSNKIQLHVERSPQ